MKGEGGKNALVTRNGQTGADAADSERSGRHGQAEGIRYPAGAGWRSEGDGPAPDHDRTGEQSAADEDHAHDPEDGQIKRPGNSPRHITRHGGG